MSKLSDSFFYQHELIQGYVRIFFISILLISIYYLSYFSNEQMLQTMQHATIVTLTFLIVAISHLVGLKIFPKQHIILRKFMILFIDIFSVTLAIWIFNEKGTLFNPLYLWIIIGYTIRFGKKFLPVSLLGSYVAIVILATYHPFWITNTSLAITLIIAITIIPIFVFNLHNEIQKKNATLELLLKKMEYQANHDTLTDLPNRYYFYSKLKSFMQNENDFSLIFLDLDGFKEINDRYGHEEGDNVLKEVANRLNESFGKEHFIARLGGDEFVCIYDNFNDNQLRPLVNNVLENITKPYGINRNINGISASIGISHYPHDTKNSFELKRFADKAMYHAKKHGKNQMIFYHEMIK